MRGVTKFLSLLASATFLVSCNTGDPNHKHTWDEGKITKVSTHTEEGEMTYTCKSCNATDVQKIAKTKGHTYGNWEKLDDEQHVKECACGDQVKENHNWELTQTILAATETTAGAGNYTCKDCGATISKVIPATGNKNELELSKNGIVVKFNKRGAKIDSIKYDGTKIAENGFVAGRVANRIANATFQLNGKTYNVNKNNGNHCLHGGSKGFGEIDWTVSEDTFDKVKFSLVSADGDQGFPGKLTASVTYTLKDSGELSIEYNATSDADTLFSPTNHLYMNLNGTSTNTWQNHNLWVDADNYTKAGSDLIPTGEIVSVSGNKLDFTTKKAYQGNNDSNLCLNGEGFRKVAEMEGTKTKIKVEVSTDRPGLQIYNDNSHICLESQAYPDAIHHSNFPSIVLKKDEVFYSKTSYTFTKGTN